MIVRLASVSLVALLAAVAATGCAKSSDDADGSASDIGTSENALSVDNDAAQEAEDGGEEAEDGLSGATADDPTPVSGSSIDAVDAVIKTNPGKYFQPAGCIVSTRVGPGDWKHVFTDCHNPSGKRTFNGTIESVWTLKNGGLQVVHTATDFQITGPNVTATVSGARTVNYTLASTTVTKTRVGTWTGTIAKNNATTATEAWSHNANFTTTWDSASKCYTRDGEVDNTLGTDAFGRKVSGYKVCGSLSACPEAGEIDITKKDGTEITITFLGNGNFDIEGAKKKKVLRKILACLVP